MKRGLLFMVCCLGFVFSRAQWVTIPDANFLTYLQDTFPTCMNGNQMDTTCPDVVNAVIISCGGQNIQNIYGVQYFDNLQTLSCCCNNLSSLPPLPKYLTELNCYSNTLSSLPDLPVGLMYLRCGYNPLHVLPTLPNTLFELQSQFNLLTNLPALPNNLQTLWCDGNQLTALPSLPSSLTSLWCMENQLTSFSYLPSGITELRCYKNQLHSIPALPDSMIICMLGHNPLQCLPKMGVINLFDFDSTDIVCLPNLPRDNWDSNPSLTSFPVCDSSNNSNGCALLNSVEAIPNSQFSFSLSPNPATNQLTINSSVAIEQINIYNTTGQLVKVVYESSPIDISSLPKGVYMAEMKTREASVMRRWVKM